MRERTWTPRIARRALLALAAAALLAALPGAQERDAAPRAKPPLRVLFVGNSYTSVNDLPALVRALGRGAKPARELEVEGLTPGGCTLAQHAAADGPRSPGERIAQGKFDFVVLQEQSQRPLLEPEAMLAGARALAAKIADAKAVPVWYVTWAREKSPEQQDALTKAYEQCAAALGGRLAPVGPAWKTVLEAKAKVRLHDEDGSHPNSAGSYLAALVIYATLTDADVDALPAKLVEQDAQGAERTLVEIGARDAKLLKQAAARALAAQRAAKR